MEFNVTDRRKLMQMFKSITFNDEWLDKLAAEYALAAGTDREKTVAMAIKAAHDYRKGHQRKENFKHLIGK